MDSFDYFLLYHKDSSKFIESLTDKNDEILIALEKLLEKGNFTIPEEQESCYDNIWKWVISSELPNERLDNIFQNLLTVERFEAVKLWIKENFINFGHDVNAVVLRVIKCVTKAFISNPINEMYFRELSASLVDILYRDSKYSEIVDALNLMVNESAPICKQICDNIWTKSFNRQDPLALQNLCYFFHKMCELNINGIDNYNTLRKYFLSQDISAKKQGIFLIKTLIYHKRFKADDEESFKKFVIIFESLQESPHLILPTLKYIDTMKFTIQYNEFVFFLLQMIIFYESSQVKNWGLNYILNKTGLLFDDQQAIIILNALNSTCLYDTDEPSITSDSLNAFIDRNFDSVFRALAFIEWISVPFYRVLECVAYSIESMEKFEFHFLAQLLKQTEVIPKKIKNLSIRSGVQKKYIEIVTVVASKVGISALKPVLINIFNMSKVYQEHLEECVSLSIPEDYETLLTIDCPEDFARFVLFTISVDKKLNEIKFLARYQRAEEKLVTETILHLERTQDEGFGPFIELLIIKTFKNIIAVLNGPEIGYIPLHIETFRLELSALGIVKASTKDLLNTIYMSYRKFLNEHEINLPIHWTIYQLLLEFNPSFSLSIVEEEIFEKDLKSSVGKLRCQLALFQTRLKRQLPLDQQYMRTFLSCLKVLVSDCYVTDHLASLLQLLKGLFTDELLAAAFLNQHFEEMVELFLTVSTVVLTTDEKVRLSCEFVELMLISGENSSVPAEWLQNINSIIRKMLGETKGDEKANIENLIVKWAELSNIIKCENELRHLAKLILTEKVINASSTSKDRLIEMAIVCEIEDRYPYVSKNKFHLSTSAKRRLRLLAAEILSSRFKEEFPFIIESYMIDFARFSSKNDRYFPNSYDHRYKLHCLQPLIFCENLTAKTIEILIDEVLNVNNQPNVTYILEILLARHISDFIRILRDKTKAAGLKAPALKSIFTIALMREKMPDSFKFSSKLFYGMEETTCGEIHDAILPYAMGQNYSVRTYAAATTVMLFKHVKSLFGSQNSADLESLAKTCNVINDSLEFKNAAKFFENLKVDFRFAMKFEKMWRVDTFYHHIPYITKMSLDEIIAPRYNDFNEIYKETNLSQFRAAMENEGPSLVMSDTIAVPVPEASSSTSANLQQKYLPYKYQIPGEKLMSDYPSAFQSKDGNKLELQTKSKLVVVASLLSRAPNLGGLARTCEIFGAENYVIESLKLTENSDFKALSKTAEKWMKISELKQWQLFEYLLGMKQMGYCIVGAEQSGKSISLINAKIPKKSVLLLGNEKQGIPANLMGLLDLIVEIPQSGVIRSLNVHVSGALVIWEYAKQHLLKRQEA